MTYQPVPYQIDVVSEGLEITPVWRDWFSRLPFVDSFDVPTAIDVVQEDGRLTPVWADAMLRLPTALGVVVVSAPLGTSFLKQDNTESLQLNQVWHDWFLRLTELI